jgi:hypothetical protein
MFEEGPPPDPAACRRRAEEFAPERFRERFQRFVAASAG